MSDPRAITAESAFRRGDYAAVERLCLEVLADFPRDAPATLLRGMVAVRERRTDEAIDLLRAALVLSPNDYIATKWLIGALYENARYDEAIEHGVTARALWPDDVQVLIGLSHAYMMGRQDIDASVDCLEAAIKLEPRNPALRCKLGAAYELLARDEDAHTQYQAAITAEPRSEEAYPKLGRLLMGHGNFVETLDICEQALRIIPNSAQVHLVYGQALRHVREFERAEAELNKAISLDPRITTTAAKWLEEDGRFEEAVQLWEAATQQENCPGSAYYGIVKSRKMMQADQPLIQRIEGLLGKRLSLQDRAAALYALGKAASDLGDYQESMRRYDEGNAVNHRLHLSGKPFDSERIAGWRRQTFEMATPEFMERHRGLGSDSNVPIFIIGMIRSGTTLTEQMLSSHPMVGGGGEQRFWLAEAPGLINLGQQTLDGAKFVAARDRYLAVLRSLEPTAPRVTDKMPMNYFVIWLIHLAFPNAKIIHIKRSPLDTALSIYMTDLAKPPEFAHNKRNIVDGYRDYQALMAHFTKLIPETSMMTVQYEDLIADQEFWTRRLIDFCDLPWDGRCLRFYDNERQVSTPSRWQVRQPIYKTSLEKWRKYEPWLGEFSELLEESRAPIT